MLVVLAITHACAAYAAEPSLEGIEFFEKKIRPLLIAHCNECHSASTKTGEGGLLVDSREQLLKGGDSGPAIVAGDPNKSLLILAISHTNKDLKMPPEKKLSDAEQADLAEWIKRGAPDPRVASIDPAAASKKPKYGVSLEEGRQFWSFQGVKSSAPPAVKNSAWPKSPIDHFILARLEAAGIAPAPPADKRTLLRRVSYDLTGLPPTSDEMQTFLADDSSQAFEKVIDRLLASPHYGERWGRHWLDVVRYADTSGNASDYPVPQAYRYRDWVIAAFNRDLPYNEFLRQQVAGDLLPSANDTERYEQVTATGYLAIARRFGGSRLGEHHLTLEDTIDNLGRTVLASTISCARCHDHKFDPFTTSDYYGLYGIFNSTRYPFPGAEAQKMQEDFVPLLPSEQVEALLKPHRERVAAAEAELKELTADEAAIKNGPDTDEKKGDLEFAAKVVAEGKKKLAAVQADAPAIATAYAVAEAKGANAKIQLRGDPKRLGDEVSRHFPMVLGGQELPPAAPSSGRLQLAEWLTEPTNPLTARVMVNRIWQHHFGQGLVQTPNDFGHQGKRPTHPELLDYLATQFIADGWSIKAMHKRILLTQVWQLASTGSPTSLQLDPTNELCGRASRRRLDAESIRDTLLMVSGQIEKGSPGPHPFPPQSTWKFTQHGPFNAVYETNRRSVYLMQSRLRKHAYLSLFDGADPSSSTSVRLPSITPLQALFMMNDPLAHRTADGLAQRVVSADSQDDARVTRAYQLVFQRAPDDTEQQECAAFLKSYREKLAELITPPDQAATRSWSALARVLLSTNEFLFVD